MAQHSWTKRARRTCRLPPEDKRPSSRVQELEDPTVVDCFATQATRSNPMPPRNWITVIYREKRRCSNRNKKPTQLFTPSAGNNNNSAAAAAKDKREEEEKKRIRSGGYYRRCSSTPSTVAEMWPSLLKCETESEQQQLQQPTEEEISQRSPPRPPPRQPHTVHGKHNKVKKKPKQKRFKLFRKLKDCGYCIGCTNTDLVCGTCAPCMFKTGKCTIQKCIDPIPDNRFNSFLPKPTPVNNNGLSLPDPCKDMEWKEAFPPEKYGSWKTKPGFRGMEKFCQMIPSEK